MGQCKYEKENYTAPYPHPYYWRNHTSIKIMEYYYRYITGSVLDVGCGTGKATYWLSLFDVSKVTGIDINPKALEFAEKNFLHFEFPYKFHCMNFVDSKLDEQFDTIVSFHVLEHIYEEDRDQFLSNIFDMLNAGGFFIISIPYEKNYEDPCHVCYYNETNLVSLLERIGFETIECFKDDRFREKNMLTGLFRKKY